VGGGGADVRFHSLVAGLGAFGGVYEHSGYDAAIALRLPPQDKDVPSFRRSIAPLLGALLSNRAHREHHARATVSFADGFGSPGICDTLFGTRWDLVSKHCDKAEQEWQSQSRK
jgi:hypothetical protein